MSKLTELLNELCPGGVEYVRLENHARTVNGLTGKKKSDFSDGNAKFITYRNVFSNPEVDLGIRDHVKVADGEKQNQVELGDVIFTGSSESREEVGLSAVVTQTPAEPIYLNSFCFVVRFEDPEFMDPRFAKHLFRSRSIRKQIVKAANGVTRINISKPRFMQIEIPVVPMEVQQEIVRVLDAFTDLEQSLVSELELRKKQLNDYRYAHFANIQETDGCAVTLGEIAEVRSGWGFPKAYQGTVSGDLPFFKVGDMNLPGNETFLHSANNYISDAQAQELKVKPAPTGSIVFPKVGAAIATNKKRILTQESAFDNNVMSLVPGKKVDSDFLFHWIQTEDLVRWGNSSGGVPSIRKSDVERVTLILPPREQQEVVASRLNVFSNLIQSIEQEINLRRTQYEFYRDELLSFVPKED